MTDTVQVRGLKEFSRALGKIDGEAAKQLRIVFNDAAEIVLSDARPKVPKRSGSAVASLKVRSTRTAVRVQFGGDKAPYYPWLDFGGRVGRRNSQVRPFLKEGRYVYRSFFDQRAKVMEAMEAGVRRVATEAGLDVG